MKRTAFLALAFIVVLISSADAAEICGNGQDDDGDNLADEGCYNISSGQCESPLSCNETGMVSPFTGSLRYSLPPDIAPKVPWGPGIGLRRFYTSQYAPAVGAPAWKKPMGERWQHTYMTWIDRDALPQSKLVLHTNRGQDIFALYSSTSLGWNYFTPQVGYHVQYIRQRQEFAQEFEIKMLTGETLVYNSSGRLIEIWDTLATPNKVLVTYDAAAQVSTVTDASLARRLLFTYSSGLLTGVQFQLLLSGTWTTQHTTAYTYTGTLETVKFNGVLAQTNIYGIIYGGSFLTQIQDAAAKTIVAFTYSTVNPTGTAGQVVRIETPRGVVGFEFAATRTGCSGLEKTVLYFNKGNATSCSVDGDCGSGFLCGGKTGTGTTGACFRAARCMVVSSPHEDVVTSVTPLGPPGETCGGACTDIAQYIWDTGISSPKLDLKATQDPVGNYTSTLFNANGLPTAIAYGDPDTDAANTNQARTVWMAYNITWPGKVGEVRRRSDLASNASSCTQTGSFGCATTLFYYNADGLNSQVTHMGTTIDSSEIKFEYSYSTVFSYDTKGRLTQIDGPLSGSNDVIVFEYWDTPTDPVRHGFLRHHKLKRDASTFVTTSSLAYDFWGNPTALQGADTDSTNTTGSVSCQTFDANRAYLAQRREAMAGQTDCSTANAADLTTSWVRDSALRLTQVTKPDGSCMFYEYDTKGRLLRIKRRDDCSVASAGDKQEFVYDTEGLVTEIQTYNALNVLTAKQPFTYFDSRKLERIINPVNTSKWTGVVYDARGLISEVNGADNIGKTVLNRDGLPGADDRVTSVSRYKDATTFDTWNLLYDWIGDQVRVTDGDIKATETIRDDLGRTVKLVSPDMTYPTLTIYDAASRIATVVEKWNAATATGTTHLFTYDNLGRPLNSEYNERCPTGPSPHAEIQRVFDAPPVACPISGGCNRTGGRLAYVKVTVLCSSSYADDGALDQETFYSYDEAGRVIGEYIRDDSGRIADHAFTWTKAGALSQLTTPSSVVMGATFGSTGNNSDTDRVIALWRTNTATPIIDAITWAPFGPLLQYNQQNKATRLQRTRITRNVANRITALFVEGQTGGTINHSVTVTEDAKGRVTTRDYGSSATGVLDSFFLYDYQNRVLCETTTLVSSCPISGTNIKNSHSASPPFTNAGDWKQLLRPIPGSSALTHVFNPSGYGTSHRVALIQQTGSFGDTQFGYDDRGNRTSDDNTSTFLHDRRDYTYDDRGNVTNVRGEYFTGGVWHFYNVASGFDARNRRVYKSFFDETSLKTAQWFFYYDPSDRLAEVRYTPDKDVPGTYSLFQLFWLHGRLVLYWQTDYPSVTTSKRYVGTDESGRPIDMWSWPASGNATRVWSINPSAWGFDTNLVGTAVYQPVLFAGQQRDPETAALENDGITVHRPNLVLNGLRTYDPFTGSYLQLDPWAAASWSGYLYADTDPVGKGDPSGLLSFKVDTTGDMSACTQTISTLEASSCLAGTTWQGDWFGGVDWWCGAGYMWSCGGEGGGGGGGGGEPTCPPNKDGAKCPEHSCTASCCDNPWFDCGQCNVCKTNCYNEMTATCESSFGLDSYGCCLVNALHECHKRQITRDGKTVVSCNTRCDCYGGGQRGAGGMSGDHPKCAAYACPDPAFPDCVCKTGSPVTAFPSFGGVTQRF